MPVAPDTLRAFLVRVDREVLRLGTREHVVAEQIATGAREQGWPEDTLGDALASAFATDREEWQEIRRLFSEHTAPPRRPPPSRWPLVVAVALCTLGLGVVLLLRLCGNQFEPQHNGGSPDAAVQSPVDLGATDLSPPPADLGCTRQAIDAGPQVSEGEQPVARVELQAAQWLGLALGSFMLALLGLLLVRLRSHLRRRLQELIEHIRAARQTRKAQQEQQQAAGRAQRDQLAEEAVETGKPTRPPYRIDLQPPVATETVEDCATLLGRAYQAQAGDELDIERTLAATLEQGGAVLPVFLPRRAVRELIVAYDATARPYLPGFLKLVARWERLGVQLTLLQFTRHPSTLHPPESREQTSELAELARQDAGASLVLFASRLMLRSRGRDLGWPQSLRAFPVHAWLDPDPRLPEERGSDEQAELEVLQPLLPRFPFTQDGLLALARYIGRPEEGAHPPPWTPPPPLSDPGMARWIELWLALGAQVPDAAMEQFEAVRQKLLHQELPDPRSIGRLLQRLRDLLGSDFNPSKATVELSAGRRLLLLLKLLNEEPGLFRRGFALLLESLGSEPKLAPGEKPGLLHHEYRYRRRWYEVGQARVAGQPVEGMLDELDGTPVHEQVQEAKQIAKGLTVGEPLVEEMVEVEQRPEPLSWREARLPQLGIQSAALAALLCGVLLGGLSLLKKWPQETVKVQQVRLALAFDERVLCPERRTSVQAHPPVVVKEPVPPPRLPPSVARPQPPRVRPSAPLPTPAADGGVLADAATPPDAGAAAPPDLAPPARVAYRPKMIPIRPASFLMGSSKYSDEKPPHEVVLTVPFLMSETEVTQGQYKAVMEENPSWFQDARDADRLPVERVSWVDAAWYCNKLSEREKLEACYQITRQQVQWPKKQGCRGYRLPTEAEWEYAARAGQKTEYAGSKQADEVAWLSSNSEGRTHPVAKKGPNAWGLYDLSGNVWEWVWDWYEGSYDHAGKENPTGPQGGSGRVVRGGSWVGDAENARVAYRLRFAPTGRDSYVGFRLARSNH